MACIVDGSCTAALDFALRLGKKFVLPGLPGLAECRVDFGSEMRREGL